MYYYISTLLYVVEIFIKINYVYIVTVRVLPLCHFCAVRLLFCVYIQTCGLPVCPGLPVQAMCLVMEPLFIFLT